MKTTTGDKQSKLFEFRTLHICFIWWRHGPTFVNGSLNNLFAVNRIHSWLKYHIPTYKNISLYARSHIVLYTHLNKRLSTQQWWRSGVKVFTNEQTGFKFMGYRTNKQKPVEIYHSALDHAWLITIYNFL